MWAYECEFVYTNTHAQNTKTTFSRIHPSPSPSLANAQCPCPQNKILQDVREMEGERRRAIVKAEAAAFDDFLSNSQAAKEKILQDAADMAAELRRQREQKEREEAVEAELQRRLEAAKEAWLREQEEKWEAEKGRLRTEWQKETEAQVCPLRCTCALPHTHNTCTRAC